MLDRRRHLGCLPVNQTTARNSFCLKNADEQKTPVDERGCCVRCSVPSGFSQPELNCSSESVVNRKLVHVRYPCRCEVHS